MLKYTLKRLVWMIFVLIGTAILIFSLMYLSPSDTADKMLGSDATPEQKYEFREKYGLNDPYIVQLGNYLYKVFLRFDFGESWVYGTSVVDELVSRIPRTLLIGVSCVLINSLLGIPLGMMAALHQNRWQDSLCMIVALLMISIPGFWLALNLVYIFSIRLGVLPAYGIGGPQYYILPIIAGAMGGTAVNARQTRSSMLEVIRADYIVTARAKGVPEKDVIRKHMLPNALIPVVTGLGVGLSKSIAGSVVVETIFAIPGVGMYLMSSISMKDYPAVEGSVIIISFFAAMVMLLVDILYSLIDPRIKAQYAGKRA